MSIEVYKCLVTDLLENRRLWRKIDGDYYEQMLNSLPPLRLKNDGFVGLEPIMGLPVTGQEVYFAAIHLGDGEYRSTLCTLAEWDCGSVRKFRDLEKCRY